MNLKLYVAAIIAFASVFLAGCSTLQTLADKYGVHDKAASAVDRYCLEIPQSERAVNRQKVNDLTEHGDAFIICNGDPAP